GVDAHWIRPCRSRPAGPFTRPGQTADTMGLEILTQPPRIHAMRCSNNKNRNARVHPASSVSADFRCFKSRMIGGDELQRKVITMQNNLALVFEVDRDTAADYRTGLA